MAILYRPFERSTDWSLSKACCLLFLVGKGGFWEAQFLALPLRPVKLNHMIHACDNRDHSASCGRGCSSIASREKCLQKRRQTPPDLEVNFPSTYVVV